MSGQSRSTGIHLPTWDEMKGRMFITGLVIIAVTLLGLWLNTAGWLSGFTTVIVVSTSMLLHTTLRGQPLNRVKRERLKIPEADQLLGTMREAPLLRPLTTDQAGRAGSAVLVGLIVAVVEFVIQVSLFGEERTWFTEVVSLSLVIFPLYSVISIYESRYEYAGTDWPSRFRGDVVSWLRVTLRLGDKVMHPIASGIVWSALRTLISAILRAIMMLMLEPIFSNWYAIGFIAVFGLVLVVGGLRVFSEIAHHVAAVALPATPPKFPVDEDRPKE